MNSSVFYKVLGFLKSGVWYLLNYILKFGILNGLYYFIKIRLCNIVAPRGLLGSVYLAKFEQRVWFRYKTSDIPTFEQVFLNEDYSFDFTALRDVQFVVDAGANVGYATIVFSTLWPLARIVAVEPDEENYNLLKKNTEPLKNVKNLKGALWHSDGTVQIKNPHSEKWALQIEDNDEANAQSISSICIESLMNQGHVDTIDLLKLDIEGAEKEIFSDLSPEVLGRIRSIIIELHDWLREGCAESFYKSLTRYKFNQFLKGENHLIFLTCPGDKKGVEVANNRRE